MRIALSLALVGCGLPEAEDPAAHACALAGDDGALDVTAGLADDDTAPAVTLDAPALVALSDAAVGWVRFESAASQGITLWLGTEDVLTALRNDGVDTAVPEESPNGDCASAIPAHVDLDAEAGTWHIGLGPSATPAVWLLLTPSAGHEDH